MSDIEKAMKQFLHTLDYDAEYADISGYAADIRALLKENAELRDVNQAVIEENRHLKGDKEVAVLKEKKGRASLLEYQGHRYSLVHYGR